MERDDGRLRIGDFHAGDHVLDIAQVGVGLAADDRIPGELVVVGRDRGAVCPEIIIAEGQGIDGAVLGDLPVGDQRLAHAGVIPDRGRGRDLRINPDGAGHHQAVKTSAACFRAQQGVEGGRVAAEAGLQDDATLRPLCRCRQRQRQRQGEQQTGQENLVQFPHCSIPLLAFRANK